MSCFLFSVTYNRSLFGDLVSELAIEFNLLTPIDTHIPYTSASISLNCLCGGDDFVSNLF